jgi:hypothetical protein
LLEFPEDMENSNYILLFQSAPKNWNQCDLKNLNLVGMISKSPIPKWRVVST